MTSLAIFFVCWWVLYGWKTFTAFLDVYYCKNPSHQLHAQKTLGAGAEFLPIMKKFTNLLFKARLAGHTMDFFTGAIVFAFILLGWLRDMQLAINNISQHLWWPNIVEGCLFLGMCFLIKYCLDAIVWRFIYQLVLSNHYGKQFKPKFRLFLAQRLQNLKFNLLIIFVKIVMIISVVGEFSYWWIYAWIILFLIDAIAQKWRSLLQRKIKNHRHPLEQGELRSSIEQLIKKSNISVKEIYVGLGNLQRLTGAMVSGYRHKYITIGKNLIKQNKLEEILAVVAHEIGHCVHHHQTKQKTLKFLLNGMIWAGLSLFIENPKMAEEFGLIVGSPCSIILLAWLWYSIIKFIPNIINLKFSRICEIQADNYSAMMCNRKHLISFFLYSSKTMSMNIIAHPLDVLTQHKHPPIVERIKNLKKLKK